MAAESKSDLADALTFVGNLAEEAAGDFKLLDIKTAEPLPGLPDHLTIALRAGKSPGLHSIRPLLEEFRTAPERRSGVAQVRTLRSFIDLTLRHKDADSAIFAQSDWPNPSLTCVVDYHTTKQEPRFGEHRIVYPFPLTREFQKWIAKDCKPMEQRAFAEFIDNNIMNLSAPLDGETAIYEPMFRTKFALPTDLIELARGLEILVGSAVKNSYRTDTGEMQLRFETQHKNANGGDLHVPGLFMLSLRAFVDGSEMRLPARLRYRVEEGALVWSFELYEWEDALRDRIAADLVIAATQTGLPAFEGAPEVAPAKPAIPPASVK